MDIKITQKYLQRLSILTVLLFNFSLSGSAQTNEIKALGIGENMPDLTISKILNYTGKAKTLKELTKGKLVILDFWGTWCTPCIAAMPNLAAMQNKFKDKVIVLTVTIEKKETIEQFFKTNSLAKNANLITIYEDDKFSKIFPHKLIPHEIIIDPSGKFLATTRTDQLTDENVIKLLNGDTSSILKKIDNLEFNKSKPLFINGNGGNGENFLYRTILTKFIGGLGNSSNIDVNKEKKISRIAVINSDIYTLYTLAYNKFSYGVRNKYRTILEYDNEENLAFRKKDYNKWKLENLYCYEMSLPAAISFDEFFDKMFQDLNRYFPVKGEIQIRNLDSWGLVRITSEDLIKTKTDKSSSAQSGKMRNTPLSGLIKYLNTFPDIEQFFDDTNYKANVDMDLEFTKPLVKANAKLDIESVRQNLKRYGLDLVKVKRDQKVLVLSNKLNAL